MYQSSYEMVLMIARNEMAEQNLRLLYLYVFIDREHNNLGIRKLKKIINNYYTNHYYIHNIIH